ncbi:hypothetical protein [Gordonia sp. IITR100]|uniref:hypothetical protein n=1 Tax=Gordonia sp. IITR100 TaxID=1314686 RepID=UPI0020CA729D|nr:hypothetical protein [Gordonia sp. IITR100]
MPPSYNEVTAWTPDQLRFIANGLFAMKARLDAEAPKAGNPVLNLTGAEWTGKARGPADDRAEAITRWLRGVADEYGDLADAMNRGAFSIEGAVTALENGTTSSESQGYVLNRGSREYEVTFEKAKAPPGAEYDANVAFQHQTALRNLGIAADQAVSDTSAAVNSALAALGGITPVSIATSSGSMTRAANQVDAFREVYGRVPVGENDWRMAAALDPHSYNPKNKGAPPVVSVIKINPVPGQGVVATGLFIPSERVVSGLNFSEFELKRNLGDARGFDPNFAPEDARVSYFIDYENGVIVARQTLRSMRMATSRPEHLSSMRANCTTVPWQSNMTRPIPWRHLIQRTSVGVYGARPLSRRAPTVPAYRVKERTFPRWRRTSTCLTVVLE